MSIIIGCRITNSRVILLNLIPTSYAKVNSTLTNESWDIGSREKYKSNWEIFNESDVKPVFSPELDICTFKKIERSLVQAAL